MEAVGEQRDDTIHWIVQMQPLLPLERVGKTSKTASNNRTYIVHILVLANYTIPKYQTCNWFH